MGHHSARKVTAATARPQHGHDRGGTIAVSWQPCAEASVPDRGTTISLVPCAAVQAPPEMPTCGQAHASLAMHVRPSSLDCSSPMGAALATYELRCQHGLAWAALAQGCTSWPSARALKKVRDRAPGSGALACTSGMRTLVVWTACGG